MSARRKPLTRRDEDTLRRIAAREWIFDRFSAEQQIQIRRLARACDMGGATERETIENTIAHLAAAVLWTLGLDPLSRDSFERFSDVVLKDEGVDGSIWEELSNGPWEAAEAWTKAQRAAEREQALKGRAA